MTPAEAHRQLTALCTAGDFQAAAHFGGQLVTASPNEPVFWFLLGCIRSELKDFDHSAVAFRNALALNPKDAATSYNLGCVLQKMGQHLKAVDAFAAVIARQPGHPQAHNNMGNALRQTGQPQQAVAAFRQAVACDPSDVDAAINLADALRALGERAEALTVTQRILQDHPTHINAQVLSLRLKGEACDFSRATDFDCARETLDLSPSNTLPFALLHLEDHPQRQRQRAEGYAKANFATAAAPRFQRRGTGPLRIGYFSGNLRNHPIVHQTAGLFRHHDTSRFETHLFSFGPPHPTSAKDQVAASFQAFHDVYGRSDSDIATFSRHHQIDIAIDLDGHTSGARLNIFANRAAPLQIAYLGFPGTLGAPFFDYIIADQIVIPPHHREHYSEKILFLPDTYALLDNACKMAEPTSRQSHGLPEKAVVLCCFNAPAKIEADVFEVWMRICTKTPNCVLWLLDSNPQMRRNLRQEATTRGVDPARLIFAPRVHRSAHLERHRHADLFVDTFIYNAHTTACDALWAGLPVVTKTGAQFAARVATSTLHAAGLPELSTGSIADYEALILDLAQNPAKIADLKSRLSHARDTEPLFDTARFTRTFERGLIEMHQRQQAGLPPEDIAL